MKVVERLKAPLPRFFKILRSIGLALLGISGTVVAAPIVLPAAVVSVVGYMAVAGGVISAVSQMTVSPLTPEGGTKEDILPFDPSTSSGQAQLRAGSAQDDTNKPRDGD